MLIAIALQQMIGESIMRVVVVLVDNLNFIMRLQESRATSQAKDQLRSTRGSFFNRTVGRDTRPAWSNRIVKDFYDLDYDLTLPKHSHRFTNTQLLQKQRLKADLLKRTTRQQRKNNPELESSPKHQTHSSAGKRQKMSLSVGMHRPETIQIRTLDTTAAKHHGLCPFEYQKTIEGKIQKRSSHHLSFQKDKRQRIMNQNPIYYDRHNDLDFSHSQTLTQRQNLKQYHPFASYLQRRVFEPREELDKFYDTDFARKKASPTKIREAIRRFEKVLERKEAKLPEGAGLAYEVVQCIQRIQRTPESYSIQTTARQTILGPQVIDPKRGCRR